MDNIHFDMIKVRGYRGRNFTLKMNPPGEHTVFVMDGNTGKTTVIELLRWCFGYPANEAKGKFNHMWIIPAHVLDESKTGPQICEITIHFKATDNQGNQHFYQFKRVTEGESDFNNKPTTDRISKIYDTLEIDHGKRKFENEQAYAFLNAQFRFNECVDYFCFDGEKAREVMQLSSNSEKIADLLLLVNQRATHPRIEEYKQKLNGLRARVLQEANAKITDHALKISIGKLNAKIVDLARLETELGNISSDIAVCSLAQKQLREKAKEVQDKITAAKATALVKRSEYEVKKNNATTKIGETRNSIYAEILDWVSTDTIPTINQIKTVIKEKGKLPEPYRKDLVQNCIRNKRCEICGRPLDKQSEERIKKLERQVAPHNVHVFLSSDFSVNPSTFDSGEQYNIIKKLINEYNLFDNRIKNIKLSAEDALLISQKETLDQQILDLNTKISDLQRDETDRKEWKAQLKREIQELEEKNAALKENKIILDKIKESITVVETAGEKIKSKTIDIIGNVISENVTSILGPKFTAKISETEGLMLGENGFYSRERGGYSGRLILSYCFAEAMTLIDPIIVDTPSGNIGGQREQLARHLCANHKQIILMCLPTEIQNFAPIVSPSTIEIENQE